MKKFTRNMILALMLCVCMLAMTGCPSEESKEMVNLKEEMVTTAKNEVSDWLSVNIPSASLITDSLMAYKEKYHIIDAVKGRYTDNGISYEFLYSLGKRKMFILDERMDYISSNTLNELLGDLLDGYSRTKYLVKSEHCSVYTVIPSIDKGEQSSREVGNTALDIQYNGLPYEVKADDILNQQADEYEFRVGIYLEIDLTGSDSLADFDLSTVRKQGSAPDKPTVWLTALSERNFSFIIVFNSVDKKERIELQSDSGTFMTARYLKLEPESKEYAEIQKICYTIDHANKTVTREWD